MPKTGTYRAKVLEIIEDRQRLLTAVDIAFMADLTYKQSIDALQALHNAGLILREGRKFTAQWGSLTLTQPAPDGAKMLEDAFRGFFKPKT
jgi:hypothetical protein